MGNKTRKEIAGRLRRTYWSIKHKLHNLQVTKIL